MRVCVVTRSIENVKIHQDKYFPWLVTFVMLQLVVFDWDIHCEDENMMQRL